MGVDKLAVVDPELRVHGVLGLRVADASVMPQIITGPGTNASAHMIAGRAAELILGRNSLNSVIGIRETAGDDRHPHHILPDFFWRETNESMRPSAGLRRFNGPKRP